MSEATVVNLFLTLRVFLLGGLLIFLPHIMRKGLLFGVYVGEAVVEGHAARQILRVWRAGCGFSMLLALIVGLGISAAGWPVTGNLTGTVVLLCAALALYLNVYAKARKLVPSDAGHQADKAVASVDVHQSHDKRLTAVNLGICLLVSLLTILYALVSYRSVSGMSIIDLIYFPALCLVSSSLFALLALFTAGAKHSLRDGPNSSSARAQVSFQAFMTRLLSIIALLFCAYLAFISVQVIGMRMTKADSVGAGVLWFSVVLLILMVIGLLLVLRKYGQGGALKESGSVESRLTGSLADNDLWVWGLFYFDRNDSAVMVEKRFGIGYTFNYGRPISIIFTITYLALTICLTVLGVVRYLL